MNLKGAVDFTKGLLFSAGFSFSLSLSTQLSALLHGHPFLFHISSFSSECLLLHAFLLSFFRGSNVYLTTLVFSVDVLNVCVLFHLIKGRIF